MQSNLYDLTYPQKSIWYTEEVFKGTPIANITGTVIIPEKVNFKLLEKAINIFVKGNDSFRLKFLIKNKEVKQYVEEYVEFPIETINIKSEKELQDFSSKVASTPFTILNSFLFVFKLIRFPDNHGGFIINMHHLISDAWSAGLGGSEIIRIYSLLLKKEPTDAILYPSYIDYIQSEKKYFNSEKINKDKAYWNDTFQNVPEIASIPYSYINKDREKFVAKRKQFSISKNVLKNIINLCKSHNISLYNFFMSLYSIYIGKSCELDEFVIGSPILNRLNTKEKHTSGMFINTIPIKFILKDDQSFVDFSSTNSQNIFNIFKHQKYQYLSILEDLRKKDSSIPNLYDILISYQNVRSTAQVSDVPFEIQWIPNGYISDNIEIHIYDMNDTGKLNIAYDFQTSKYSDNDIYSLHMRILNMAEQIIKNDKILIKDIQLITPDEEYLLTTNYNATAMNYDETKTISMLIEEQAAKTPDRTAVICNNKELTYKELNEKSNSLAYYLRKHGVKPNDIVRNYGYTFC